MKEGLNIRLAGERGALSRSEALVQALSQEIFDGVLSPGQRLDETAIAQRFEVSRTPVREALQALVASGLATKQHNRGVVVATITRRRLAEMFEVMADIEALCAGYAAERMEPSERYALDAFHQDSARLVRSGDPADYERFNTAFHNAIYAGSHNEYLEESARYVRQRLKPFRGAQFRLEHRLSKSFEEHQKIVDAILRGDAAGATAAMNDHVRVVGVASEQFALDSTADTDDGAETGDSKEAKT